MGLADKLNSIKRTEPGLPCGVARVLAAVEGEDKEALELVFQTRSEAGTISNRQIHEILLSEGYDISHSSIALHRRKQCRCFVGKNSQIRQEIARES